jgi:hypothetical protein
LANLRVTTGSGSALSLSNATAYFWKVADWARDRSVPLFYFSAFDEDWKLSVEGDVGASWGLWTSAGDRKPGIGEWFDGGGTNYERLPGGPGAPQVQLIYTPPMGEVNRDLEGQVLHLDPSTHRIGVYVRVNGLWYLKPSQAAPFTSIAVDGYWSADIVTGGQDPLASEIAVFVWPLSYVPPTVLGTPSLPSELAQRAVASTSTMRTAGSISGVISGPSSLRGVSVTASGLGMVKTSRAGNAFSFASIPGSGSTTIMPSYKGSPFDPANRTVSQSALPLSADFSTSGAGDLSVEVFLSRRTVTVGSTLKSVIVVTNLGTTTVTNITVAGAASGPLRIAFTDYRCSVSGGNYNCFLSSLAGGASEEILLDMVSGPQLGPGSVSAFATSFANDPDISSNSTIKALTVVSRASVE